MSRERDRSGLILHLFVAVYEERQETWLQTECGVLVGTCNGSHDIAKAWETPTCPACKEIWAKHQPRPRKWHDGVSESDILLRARQIIQEHGPFEGYGNGADASGLGALAAHIAERDAGLLLTKGEL